MPNLIMKCPNCGADMRLIDNQFECPYCHTISFSITDSKIDGDVTVMDPDEFARKLEESKRQFVVNIRDHLQVLDVETAVVNKKIADATLLLRHRDFLGALRALPSTEKPVLSAERIAFLATFNVVNETELMLCSEPVEKNSHFQKILQLADEKTRATYLKIAECTKERAEMLREIEDVEKLLEVDLKDEAAAYAKKMCRKYPYSAFSWAKLYKIKLKANSRYDGSAEYEMIKLCPDCQEAMPPNLANHAEKYEGEIERFSEGFKECKKYLNLLIPCYAFAAWLAVMTFYLNIGYYDFALAPALSFILMIGIPVALIAVTVVLIKKSELSNLTQIKRRFDYDLAFAPQSVRNRFPSGSKAYMRTKGTPAIQFAAIAAILVLAVCLLVYYVRPVKGGMRFEPASGGYTLESFPEDTQLLIIPDSILKIPVIGWRGLDENDAVRDVVIPESLVPSTLDFDDAANLQKIFFDSDFPDERHPEWDRWEIFKDDIAENFGCDAQIYWSGEWEWRDGKPVAL